MKGSEVFGICWNFILSVLWLYGAIKESKPASKAILGLLALLFAGYAGYRLMHGLGLF